MDELNTTQDLARDVVLALQASGVKLACAESLTGGEVCSRLVDIGGVSEVLQGGVVAYATPLKARLLGVDEELLANGGPVQDLVARQMATGVAELCEADIGVATTGVAGPGASSDGPAGLVYIASAWRSRDTQSAKTKPDVQVRELHLDGGRDAVRTEATRAAYRLLLEVLGAASTS